MMIDPIQSFMGETVSQMPEEVAFFPLPNMVLLPGEPMPLHIFEERYKIMTEVALAGNRLIALGHFRPETVKKGSTKPEFYGVAGLGRIVMEERLQGGKFNLVLLGLRRVRIREVIQETPFPKARIEILNDRFSETSSNRIETLSADLLDLFDEVMTEREVTGAFQESEGPVLDSATLETLPLGTLCDVLGAALILTPQEKQVLLDETDVIKRAETLLFALHFELESYRNRLNPKPDF